MNETNGKTKTDLAVLQSQYVEIQKNLARIEAKSDARDAKLENDYLTRREFDAEFGPVKKIVFGGVGVVLLTVVGAVLALVITTKQAPTTSPLPASTPIINHE